MLQSSPVPHTWAEFAWLSIAAILGYLATHLPSLFRSKQSKAEEAKTLAESRRIDVQANIESGQMWMDLLKLSAQATLDAERLRREKEFWQGKAERLEEKKVARSSGEHPRISE